MMCRSRILMWPSEDRYDEGWGRLGIQQRYWVIARDGPWFYFNKAQYMEFFKTKLKPTVRILLSNDRHDLDGLLCHAVIHTI